MGVAVLTKKEMDGFHEKYFAPWSWSPASLSHRRSQYAHEVVGRLTKRIPVGAVRKNSPYHDPDGNLVWEYE